MYKLTNSAKSQFIKLLGFEPTEEKLKEIFNKSYCVQFYKKFVSVANNYIIRPEIYFYPNAELCFACDRYKRKIFAIYKAEKGFLELKNRKKKK